MKKHLLIELLGVVVIATAALIMVAGLPGRSAQQSKENLKSLRLQAQHGSVTAHGHPRNLKRYDDLKPLVKESGAIVIGTVQSQASRLIGPEEQMIATDYQVDVSEVLNGELATGQSIDVRGPGGRVDFGDGTFAQVEMPEFWSPPETGGSYVFFLKKGAEGKFRLNGGPQGLFRISDDVITPQGKKEDKLMQAYNGKSRAAFISEIRDALKAK